MKYKFQNQVAAILKDAAKEAKDMGNNYIGSEHVLLALLKDTTTKLSQLLGKQGLCYLHLKDDLMILFSIQEKEREDIQLTQMVEELLERCNEKVLKQGKQEIDADTLAMTLLEARNCVAYEILLRFDIDIEEVLEALGQESICELDRIRELRNLNRSSVPQHIVGREKEIAMMISILSRKEKANPLLLGEPGVGKSALVEKLASMIAQKQVPKRLQNDTIYELHLNTLVAGTKYRGDFEEKLQKLIGLLEKYPNVILFVDEIHQMIGAGKSEGSIDVASVLKPYLARGKIRCIGATTFEEYDAHLAKDRALERRFQVVKIKEPTQEETLVMLKAKQQEYEQFHAVTIEEEAFQSMVKSSAYYMPQRKFPDKAFDVFDLSCVFASTTKEKVVTATIVSQVVEQLTNIPTRSKDRMQEVQQALQETIQGQDAIIAQLMRQLKWIEQGIVSQRPLGTWLFTGPKESGKKTMMKTLMQAYFHHQDYVELDVAHMEHALPSVITKLKRNPYTILWIPALQDASLTTLHLLKKAMKNNRLEMGEQKAELRHTIVIFSQDADEKASMRFEDKETTLKNLSKTLGKEFVQSLDEICVFASLRKQEKVAILWKQAKQWNWSLQPNMVEMAVDTTDTIQEALRQLKSTCH